MINICSSDWEIDNVESIIFDKDGTLIDSHIYWGRIIELRANALAKELSLNISAKSRLIESMGFSIKQNKLKEEGPIALLPRHEVINILLTELKDKNITYMEIDHLFVDIHKEFNKEISSYLKLLPGVKELLESLTNRNVSLSLVTSDSLQSALQCLEILGISKYFKLVYGKESCSESKGTGVPVLKAIKELNLNSKTTITLGDAPVDIEMGDNAGLRKGIAVATGQISFEALKRYTPYVIMSFKELIINE